MVQTLQVLELEETVAPKVECVLLEFEVTALLTPTPGRSPLHPSYKLVSGCLPAGPLQLKPPKARTPTTAPLLPAAVLLSPPVAL